MKNETSLRYHTWAVPRLLVLALCSGAGCEKKAGPPPAASVSVAPAESKPKPPEAPWYVGSWIGTYQAERQLLDASKPEAIAGWQEDDGSLGSGSGKIELSAAEDGSIAGKSSGPLGETGVTGQVDGETFRVQLVPQSKEPATAFQGFFVATRSGEQLEGPLQVSSGDGNLVRKGTVALAKKPK